MKYAKLFFLTFAIMSSCTEPEINDPRSFQLEDGLLSFQSQQDFDELIGSLKKMDDSGLVKWAMEFNPNALYLIYDELGDRPTETDLALHEVLAGTEYPHVPDPAFASILNDDGMYAIGGTYYKIGKEKEFESSNLSDLTQNNLLSNTVKSSVIQNNFSVGSPDARTGFGPLCADDAFQAYTIPYEASAGDLYQKFWPRSTSNGSTCKDSNISFHVIIWHTAYSNYASWGFRIRGRKKKSSGWKNDPMNYAQVDVEYPYSATSGVWTVLNYTKNGTNTKNVILYFDLDYNAIPAVALSPWISEFTYDDDGVGPNVVEIKPNYIP